jgi:DNA-binding Lrp family transcriptional regulator
MKLDDIDLRILSDLQDTGRMTNVELASRAGISPPPCLRRVRALEDAGYICGYHAQIAPQLMGYAVTIFAQVGLGSQKGTDLAAFQALVDSWPEVRECHYQYFLTEKLTAAPNVLHVKSSLAVKSTKSLPGVPIAVRRAGG